jgi:tetratricopeptide (TPR) repeat protein
MLEYRLDDLHWSDFEKLCQALLKAQLSVGVETWGGSGDWGNDAYCQASLRYPGSVVQEGPFQFQVKFVEGANAAGAKPKALLVAAVKRECERIRSRSMADPRVYSLLTNAGMSADLRKTVKELIQDALPDVAVVVHDGNDICSWLHMHEEIIRAFPQLLSHRNLSELVKQSLSANEPKTPAPRSEPSALLKKKRKQARAASRKHNVESAVRLWRNVQTLAEKEGNKAESICARMEIILTTLQIERNLDQPLSLAEKCLQEARSVDLGDDRCRLLQLIGEIHRLKGDKDQARGFAESAFEQARKIGSQGDEGFALLSLSALELDRQSEKNDKALELIARAYNAFSSLYANGDEEGQRRAKDGFAQCHCWRAEIFDHARPDDALAEWARALEIYQGLGKDWQWNVADTFMRRADLRSRTEEHELAADDLVTASKLFLSLGDTAAQAKCLLKAGEFLDAVGKRKEAFEYYHKAGAIATSWKNDSRASYYYFRYACKLIELDKINEAEPILIFLTNADWLEPEHKLTAVTQLCFVARGRKNDEELKERCAVAMGLIDGLIRNAVSADARRKLTVQKGMLFEQLDQHEKALEQFRKAIEGFELAGDRVGVIECWSHIRSVWQQLKDRVKEREAAEKILALDAEKVAPMIAAMTLVMLAQLNIVEQRFAEARAQIGRARELDSKNPAVIIVSDDLRTKLPNLSSESGRQAQSLQAPPERDLSELLHELEDWCAHYPARRKTILIVWYYIHRTDLWSVLRSMLGVKFMICADGAENFDRGRKSLFEHGDLFVWATNFDIKPRRLTSVRSVEKVPVPTDFLFPAGTSLISRAPIDPEAAPEKEACARAKDSELLRPAKGSLTDPYYIAFMKSAEHGGDARPHFVGRKQAWDDLKVVKFMLGRSANELIADRRICLPLHEGEKSPNLKRSMDVARENGAIPVFLERLPHSDEISCVCDAKLDLPAGPLMPHEEAKELWQRLLACCQEAPKASLASFTKGMSTLSNSESARRVPARVYMLSFRAGGWEVVHPAVVMLRADS